MIGYYAHHRGSGHLSRGGALARCLDEPVTLLCTAPASQMDGFADTVELADDVPGEIIYGDPTAQGQLHWAPCHHRGLQRRMAQVARWVELARPSVVVVDVSVEVATMVRLLGAPVVVVAMPGNRADAAHQWGYGLADRIIAPWTREVYNPPWLWPFVDRVHYVGSFSRFDTEPSPPTQGGTTRHGLVLGGTGGTTWTASAADKLGADQPQVSWDVIGAGGHWVDDVWSRLCKADVVVSHAGQNAVAEVAAARRPAVLVAEPRPHDEQIHTARALAAAGVVRWAATWDDVGAVLARSPAGPDRWELWAPAGAVEAAALVVQKVRHGTGSVTSRVAVVTTVAGRHEHLLRQRHGLRGSARVPDKHVLVSMGDPDIRGLVEGEDACVVVDIDAAATLPLARARNLGAAEARRHGADILVFLDVDCIPSADLVGRYAALADTEDYGGSLLCGQVCYLPPGFTAHTNAVTLERYGIPHPVRPVLRQHEVVRSDDYDLFWSLSFAISGTAWEQVGGFCEAYTGYGAEDTDYAQCAKAAGLAMHWIGGATAYHQYHPVSDPPIEHLADILRNAKTFAERWGRWPMHGWLKAFERQGLVAFDQATGTWQRTE